jgi:hypothetical protein
VQVVGFIIKKHAREFVLMDGVKAHLIRAAGWRIRSSSNRNQKSSALDRDLWRGIKKGTSTSAKKGRK